MNLFRYKKYKVWAKCIIAVTCVALFALPLSHKFYLSPDIRYGTGHRHKYFHDHRFTHSARPLMNYNKLSSFSPDKRYDLRHTLELVDPQFRGCIACIGDRKKPLSYWQRYNTSSFLFTAFRGPPIA